MNLSEAPYSFLGDANVPDFDPPAYFTVMDAQCGLCAKGAAWIARHDLSKEFRIIPMQSELGSALLRHYGMDPGDPLSWLYVKNGHATILGTRKPRTRKASRPSCGKPFRHERQVW